MKAIIRKLFKLCGYRIEKLVNAEKDYDRHFGVSEDADIAVLLRNEVQPLIFDIGANIGQSVERFRKLFPESEIFSFEPEPLTFDVLKTNVFGPRTHVHELALSNSLGAAKLFLNTYSDMNSLLDSSNPQWGKRVGDRLVKTETVDHFCAKNGITKIDLLKTDTQGHELQVLQGCKRMMSEGRIKLVTMEVIFSEMYNGISPFNEVWKYMIDNNFRLVSFYQFYYKNQLANWSDALFAKID